MIILLKNFKNVLKTEKKILSNSKNKNKILNNKKLNRINNNYKIVNQVNI